MDWYTIEFLYPLSFKKFVETMFPNVGVISISTLNFYDIKKLYQFFDKEGIFLTTEMYKPNQWVFSISLHNGVVFGPEQDAKETREEIECEGFIRCFKLLDKQIRDCKL